MKTTQHTPLPWRIADSSTIWSGDQPVCTIAHEENSNLSAEEADANQAFIVTACNAFYQMREALQAVASAHANTETCDMPSWLEKVESALASSNERE